MNLNEVIEKALELVKVNEEEKVKANQVINEVLEKLEKTKKELGIDALIELHGSFAHDTFLSDDKDIDIFILSKAEKNEAINNGLKIAKACFPNHIERYAEHPFITVNYKGYNFDIVPAVLIEEGEEIKTAADRTRLHTVYLKKVLNDELRDQIRLFKKFLKTIELYGAEIKVEGFSGYLCELLIIHYGSFLNLIKEAVKWREYKTVIGGEWKLQPAPLVVVDPVDKSRNVAAAFKKISLFKFACNLFLSKPSLKFFQGRKYSEDINLALKIFEERNTKVFVIEGRYPNIPPDVFWGEVKRAKQSFTSFLEENEIYVLDSKIYSDEKEKFAILFEVDKIELPLKKKLKGPLINDINNVKRFIEAHKKDELLVENSRIYAYTDRKIRNIFDAFQRWLKVYSIPKDLINVLNESKTYLLNENVSKEIARAAVDLALKDLWWLRDELIEKFNVKLIE